MDIHIKDERYICSKIGSEVIISSISDPSTTDSGNSPKLLFYPVDCDHKNLCGIVQMLKGDESINWKKCIHPELNGYEKLKN